MRGRKIQTLEKTKIFMLGKVEKKHKYGYDIRLQDKTLLKCLKPDFGTPNLRKRSNAFFVINLKTRTFDF